MYKEQTSYCSILNNRVGKGHGCQQCTNTGAGGYKLDPQFSLATKEPEKAKLFLRLLSENEEKELEKMQRLQPKATNSIQVLKWKEIKTKTTGPNEITPHSNKYAWWRCEKKLNNPLRYHPTTINNKVQKGGCSVCSNGYITRANSLRTYVETRSPELDFIKEIFVKIVEGNIGIDDKRWEGSGPDNFGPDSHFKTEWECINYKHNTKTSIAKRVKDKQSCGQCRNRGKAAYLIYKDLKEEFFNDIKQEYNLKQEYPISTVLGDLDMYIPSLKLAIEFDPDFTHKDKDQNRRDQDKVNTVESAGCKIIRLREEGLNPIGDNCVIFEKYNGNDKNLKKKIMRPLLEKIEKLFPKTISEKKLENYNKLEDFKYRKEAETEFLNKDKSYQTNLF